MLKHCSKCKVGYPATSEYFILNKKRKDGFDSWCRVCGRKCNNARYQRNKDKVRKSAKEHYQKNKDYYKEHNKEYRRIHKNNYREYCKTLKGYIACVVKGIVQRCTNPNNKRYNGYKNIKLCFTSSELYKWCIDNKIEPRGLQIHRIKTNGDYTLNNIEFLTASEHTKLHNDLRTK